jgi:hypothetical protein
MGEGDGSGAANAAEGAKAILHSSPTKTEKE